MANCRFKKRRSQNLESKNSRATTGMPCSGIPITILTCFVKYEPVGEDRPVHLEMQTTGRWFWVLYTLHSWILAALAVKRETKGEFGSR